MGGEYFKNTGNFNEYLPDFYKDITEEEHNLGHGGMDYFQFKVF